MNHLKSDSEILVEIWIRNKTLTLPFVCTQRLKLEHIDVDVVLMCIRIVAHYRGVEYSSYV